MNHNLAFAEAARPRLAVVLHLKMLPYSIGHELLLTAEQNAMLLPNEDFNKLPAEKQRYAVNRAAQICCRTWEENNSLPLGRFFLWRWRMLNRKSDYPFDIASFRNYRADGSTYPHIAASDGDGRMLGSPIVARLLNFFGRDQMDLPMGFAMWLYFAHAETEGMCKVENEKEKTIREQIHKAETDPAELSRLEDLKKSLMKQRKGAK